MSELSDIEKLNEIQRYNLRYSADAKLLAENTALRAEVERLKDNASKAVCVYCGHLCEKDLLVMGQHAAECENHPIHEVLRLRAELERVRRLETALCVWIQDKVEEFFGDELSEEIAEEVMAPLGYFERVPYDPEKHGDLDLDKGDEFWHFTEQFNVARARKDSHAD